jgi:oligoendopeptidase F
MFNTLPSNAVDALAWGVEKYQPFFEDLQARPLSAETVDQFLADWTKIGDLIGEVLSRLNVATTQDVTDEAAKAKFLGFIENALPVLMPLDQALKQKLLASKLEPAGFEIPLRNMRVEVEIFRESNIPLMVEERKLGTAFDEVTGAQTVQWNGQEIPLPQIYTEATQPDRAIREAAWRTAHSRYLDDRDGINNLWVSFLNLRQQMARNAGFDSYIEYRWKQMGRFDYSAKDCQSFHNAIEQVVVPAAARLYEKRRQTLGVSTLRPWDLGIDPTHPADITALGDEPLRPFSTGDEMDAKAAAIFQHVDPALGDYYATMQREGLLDLANRKGKAPGGYCTTYPVARRPFIFMNAVGLHNDVQTLLHEAGHAFHAFEAMAQPYMQLRDVPIEFAEVASMSMEKLAAPYLTKNFGGYYTPAEAARARIEHLQGAITFWTYMAVVDAFQHWVYNNIEAAKDPANCDAAWGNLWNRFMVGVDWSGLEAERVTGWHRKLHIHQIPFYYVEYGLAQLGSVQVWANALRDQAGAVASYRKALALGGSVTLPKLFEVAGAKFAFDAETLAAAVTLVELVIEQLEQVK